MNEALNKLVARFISGLENKGEGQVISPSSLMELYRVSLRQHALGGLVLARASGRKEEQAKLSALLEHCDDEERFDAVVQEWIAAHDRNPEKLFKGVEGTICLEKEMPLRILVWWVTSRTHKV